MRRGLSLLMNSEESGRLLCAEQEFSGKLDDRGSNHGAHWTGAEIGPNVSSGDIEMTEPTAELSGPARVPLNMQCFLAKDPRAVVIVAPAMGVSQSFYRAFAEWLRDQGITTWTFDYRGTGDSRPASLRGFQVTVQDWARLDCREVLDRATLEAPGLPVYWIGHSVGAQIFGLIPNQHKATAMMSVAAGSGYWRYNAAPLRYYVHFLWFVVSPLAMAMSGYFPGKKLGMVGDLPYGVMEEWRRWCLSERYMGSDPNVRQTVAEVKVPITALSFTDDEMMTHKGTTELFRLYESAKVEVRSLAPKTFAMKRIGHFGFFRKDCEKTVWPLVTEWVDQAR